MGWEIGNRSGVKSLIRLLRDRSSSQTKNLTNVFEEESYASETKAPFPDAFGDFAAVIRAFACLEFLRQHFF
jgi:hypothetical protein